MVSQRTNFGERSEPAPDRSGKLQSVGGGAAQSNVSPLSQSSFIYVLSQSSFISGGTSIVVLYLKLSYHMHRNLFHQYE